MDETPAANAHMRHPQRDDDEAVACIALALKELRDGAASLVREDGVLNAVRFQVRRHRDGLPDWSPHARPVVDLRLFGARVIKQGSATCAFEPEAPREFSAMIRVHASAAVSILVGLSVIFLLVRPRLLQEDKVNTKVRFLLVGIRWDGLEGIRCQRHAARGSELAACRGEHAPHAQDRE